jgi:hypothetical protein
MAHHSVGKLLLVAQTLRLRRFGLRLGESGQEQRGQNGNDGYDDQQLDKREGGSGEKSRPRWRCGGVTKVLADRPCVHINIFCPSGRA